MPAVADNSREIPVGSFAPEWPNTHVLSVATSPATMVGQGETERRSVMENIETKGVERTAVAEPDPDMECIKDCCICCCCDTEEECSVEE